jgi:hypothetical protein
VSGRTVVTFRDQLTETNRRLTRQEGRRQIGHASDLMGPGLAPQAVLVTDWNDETMAFNGLYYSEAGSLNSPNDTQRWIGQNIVDPLGHGIQRVALYVDNIVDLGTWTPALWVRAFVTPDGTTRVFSAWTSE